MTPADYTRESGLMPWLVRRLILAGVLRLDHRRGRPVILEEPPMTKRTGREIEADALSGHAEDTIRRMVEGIRERELAALRSIAAKSREAAEADRLRVGEAFVRQLYRQTEPHRGKP